MKKKSSDNNVIDVNSEKYIKQESPFIVTIGASAGGLDALKAFLRHSIPYENVAFVIIMHLNPEHVSILPGLLQQYTQIKVLSICDNQKILGNHIYVLPQGKKVAIKHGIFELINENQSSMVKLPIDFFLCSLAKDQGHKAVGIIMSGMGHDGTLGIRILRDKGGLVIVQTISSAGFEAMPKSAINTGLVDYILPPEDMYPFLLKYIAHFSDKTVSIEDNISREMHKVLKLIKSQTGHDFTLYKPNTIFRRVQKRLGLFQINTISEYVYFLHQHPAEINVLFKELLINVTKQTSLSI